MRKKITLVVENLSANPIVRAYPIALALQRLGYEVEVVGFLLYKNKVFPPYADKFEYKTVFIKRGIFNYLRGLPKLVKLMDGDIIYGFKPRMTSLFPAMLKSWFGHRKPLLFDAEDEEMNYSYSGVLNFINRFLIRGWNSPNSHFNMLMLHRVLKFCPSKKRRTMVSTKLQKRYGGVIVHHGPDEVVFDPSNFDPIESRKKFDLPQKKILVLFAGMPHKHKGIDTIVNALIKTNSENYALVCAGPASHDTFVKAKEQLGNNCYLLGMVPNDQMPELLSAVDICPMLQKQTKFTESQMPAKLFESMSMEKIVISTNASDIGSVLGIDEEQKRGFILDFDDDDQLVEIFIEIEKDFDATKAMTKAARHYFLEESSVGAIMPKLERILAEVNF